MRAVTQLKKYKQTKSLQINTTMQTWSIPESFLFKTVLIKKKESWHQEIYLLNMRTNSQNVTTNWIKRSYANKE